MNKYLNIYKCCLSLQCLQRRIFGILFLKFTFILSVLLLRYQLHIRRIYGVENWLHFRIGAEDINFNAFYKSQHFGLCNK